MNKSIFILFIFSICSVLLPIVNAQSGHMKLLAVSETQNGEIGGIADLYLEISPGKGRVFLETFPLTKVDTQISTRLAKEIACDYSNADCSRYDFFYTITADSPIIAGPSAGAAITILTFSLINNVKFDENTAITGTINSGGLIGPVGGLKAKIDAASKAGIKKVLIPFGEAIDGELNNETEEYNETLNIQSLRDNHSIEIIEVSTLDEALFEFTGKKFREKKNNLTISQSYKDTMKLLAIELCSRSTRLRDEASDFAVDNRTRRINENAVNLSVKGRDSFRQGMFYSSASYCFGSNVEFNYVSLLSRNPKEKEIVEKVQSFKVETKKFNEQIDNEKLKTITDLESYMVVKERLKEADDFLNLVLETLNDRNSSLHNLAYAEERIGSARSWSQFMKNTGKEFDLKPEVISNACRIKLAEVEERLQYVQLYLPESLGSTRKEIGYAYKDLEDENYELCLFRASKAKANVDTVLSVFGVRTNNVKIVVENKLEIAERNIVEQTEKGVFPILGYSYLEYANSLKDSDIFSALLYSGYALELSNLDIYLKTNIKPQSLDFYKIFDVKTILILAVGMILGILIASKYHSAKYNKGKRKKGV